MALENITGRIAWIFPEEDFDVDQIVGVKNIKITDIEELAAQAMRTMTPVSPSRSVRAMCWWAA